MFIGIAREDADAAVDKMAETTLRAEHLREDADAAVDSKFFGERKTRQLCPANVPWYRDNGSGNASGQRKIAARGSGQRRAETTEAGRGRGRGAGSGKICRISD